MILRLTFPLFLIQNLITISKEYSVITARGGRTNRIQYIKQYSAEFIVTGQHINPGYTGHATLHVIHNQGVCVYFVLYCLNYLDLVILKPQVKLHIQQCLAGFTANICVAIWLGSVCHSVWSSVKQEAENIGAPFFHYSHP